MSTTETTTRPAAEGEDCDCGQPAKIVYETERHGDVPYCGIPHGGDNHPGELLAENERVVVIPEITIPAGNAATAERVTALLAEIAPQLDELHAAAMEVREQYHRALIVLYPYLGTGSDEVHELAAKVTGWGDVWNAVTGSIGDRFTDEGDMALSGLTNAEIARGGERNFPAGTIATVEDPDGNPFRVEVEWSNVGGSPGGGSDRYQVINLADPTNKRYGCTHEDLKAGLELLPDPAEREEIRERHFAWRLAAMENERQSKQATA